MATGGFELIDETAGQVVLMVDSSGNVGVNGASGAQILSVGGAGIIKSTSVAYDNTIITVSSAPTTASVSITGGSTTTVTTSLGALCTVSVDNGSDVDTLATNSFVLRNNGATGTVHYSYW